MSSGWVHKENVVDGEGYMFDGYTSQHYLDGEALAKLRETLPEGWGISFYDYITPSAPSEFQPGRVQVGVGPSISSRPYEVTGWGMSIAEAADKCREALG